MHLSELWHLSLWKCYSIIRCCIFIGLITNNVSRAIEFLDSKSLSGKIHYCYKFQYRSTLSDISSDQICFGLENKTFQCISGFNGLMKRSPNRITSSQIWRMWWLADDFHFVLGQKVSHYHSRMRRALYMNFRLPNPVVYDKFLHLGPSEWTINIPYCPFDHVKWIHGKPQNVNLRKRWELTRALIEFHVAFSVMAYFWWIIC